MESLKRLVKNTGAMMIARGIQPVLNFLLVVFISRLLGVEGLGKYTTIFALFSIFQLICAFGIRMLLTREIAKFPDQVNKYLTNGIVVVAIFSLISICVMLMTIFLLKYDSNLTTLASYLSIGLVASALIECFIGVLAGFERLNIVASVTILEEIIKLILSIALLYFGFGLKAIVFIFVALRYFNALLTFYFIVKLIVKPHFEIDFKFCKKILKDVRYFALSIIFVSIYWRMDVVILSKYTSIADVGIYSASLRIFRFVFILIQSFFAAFYPVLSKLFLEDKSKFERACFSSAKYFLISTIPFALIITFLSDKIITIIFGRDFTSSILVLQILIWALIPFTISKVLSFAMLAGDRQKDDLKVNIVSTIIKFSLLIVFVIYYGYIGVTIGTIIAVLLMVAIQLVFTNKSLIPIKLKILVKPFLKIIFSGIAMLLIILLVRSYSVIAALVGSVLIYCGMLYQLKIFSNRDKFFLQSLFPKKAYISRVP